MATYRIKVSTKYLRDLKRARRRNLDESKLNEVVRLLMNGETLPPKNKDHCLVSNYKGCRECHISPDWLLIYRKEEELEILSLLRTGSHSDIF